MFADSERAGDGCAGQPQRFVGSAWLGRTQTQFRGGLGDDMLAVAVKEGDQGARGVEAQEAKLGQRREH